MGKGKIELQNMATIKGKNKACSPVDIDGAIKSVPNIATKNTFLTEKDDFLVNDLATSSQTTMKNR